MYHKELIRPFLFILFTQLYGLNLTYVLRSAVGTKGAGNIVKGSKVITNAANAPKTPNVQIPSLFPFGPQHQLANVGPVPYNVVDSVNLRDQLMMSAKRFSDYQHNPPKKIQALPEKVVNTLSNFDSRKMKFGQHEFLLDKKGMKHILERHHPSYWNGTTKTKQTFINNHLTPDDIADIVHSVLKQNREELLLKRLATRLRI